MPNLEIQWGGPLANWRLEAPEAHLWAEAMGDSSKCVFAHADIPSGSEDEHAWRLHFERNRQHLITGCGTLRAKRDGYLEIEPALFQFDCGNRRETFLAILAENHTLNFDLPDSGGLLLVAVGEQFPPEAEVERIRLGKKPDELVERFSSRTEVVGSRAFLDQQRTQAFFRFCTRKRACLKATGDRSSIFNLVLLALVTLN